MQAFGTIVGALIGAFAVMAGAWLNRKDERNRAASERARAAEEHERAEINWLREKLLEVYSGCIYYSMKLSVSSVGASAKNDRDVRQHFAETLRYLLLLRAYSRDQVVLKNLSKCSEDINENWQNTTDLSNAADRAAKAVEDLLSKDDRVRGPDQGLTRPDLAPKSVGGEEGNPAKAVRYSDNGGGLVAIVHCPAIAAGRLIHLSHARDTDGWVIRDYIAGQVLRCNPVPNPSDTQKTLAEVEAEVREQDDPTPFYSVDEKDDWAAYLKVRTTAILGSAASVSAPEPTFGHWRAL